jgi:hypothetical protein
MNKYFLAISGLIIFSILIILYIRISERLSKSKVSENLPELKDVKEEDFVIFE